MDWVEVVVLLAQNGPEAESSGINVGLLGQYGVLGIFAMILVGFARTSYKREVDRSDRLEQEVTRLNTLIQDKHIPALESATHALTDATDLIHDIQREREMERLRREAAEDRELERLRSDAAQQNAREGRT